MKAIVCHGWGEKPKNLLQQWIKNLLEKEGFEVIIPEMPETNHPKIKPWVNKLKETSGKIDEDTYFIGHSIGCQTILRYLSGLDAKIKIGKVILIAPWLYLDENTIAEEGQESIDIAKPWVENPIEWKKVKIHTKNFICIFSDNDPFVPLSNQEEFKRELGAKIFVEHNKEHYTGAETYYPDSLKLILNS